MKQLNEAFDVLIDDSKRANFDNILAKKRELEAQKKQQNTFYNTAESNFTATRPANIAEANKISYSNNGYYTDRDGNFYVNTHNMDDKTKQKLQSKLQEKYLEAYDAYLRQHGYKLKYKWTFKRVMQVVLAVIIAIAIFTVLFFIPPIHEYFVGLYEENIVIRVIVNLISSFFKAIFSIF